MHKEIIQQYLLSTKSQKQTEEKRIYTFYCHPGANKFQLKQALKEIFPNVKVKKVRTSRQKPVMRGASLSRKFPGVLKTKLRKKVFVELYPGYKLDN